MKTFFLISLMMIATATGFEKRVFSAEPLQITVYKSPTCGCCAKWVNYLEKNGFKVQIKSTAKMDDIKTKYKIPESVRSCHTATIGDYVIEGHVPVDSIKRLLKEKPDGIVGISVPGMPVGSPGMEGDEPESYDVVTFNAKGKVGVFDKH